MREVRHRRPFLDRFMEKISYEPNTGCWLWTGALLPNGYGHICPGGDSKVTGTIYAHRASIILLRGIDPTGFDACHKCDVRSCVNPDHLFIGTRKDNMQDCVSKGRTMRGTQNVHAKLTDEQVLDIRTRRLSAREFARLYATHYTNIKQIQRNVTWRHLVAQPCMAPVQRDMDK